MLSPGDTFGRYAIDAVLGEGGMGRVYRAEDTLLGRRVALKVLHADDAETKKRVLREARAGAALNHPNVISVFDVGEIDGVPFLAMEYLEGKPLRAYVGDGGVPVSARVAWLKDAAKALAAAHSTGLVHRDVKPENVFVTEAGVVKVLDFGIARRSAEAAASITTTGGIVGTPRYMAPEQMLGESIDGRADQFAWGVVAFELLTGAFPWGAPSDAVNVIARVMAGPREKLAGRSGVPADVAQIVDRALEREPGARFASMGDVVDALDRIATDATVRAAPLSATREKGAPKRTTWVLALGGMVVVAAASAALVWSRRSPDSATTPSADTSAASASSAPAPALITDFASSVQTTSSEAATLYASALQKIRDAATDSAVIDLQRAATLDPAFAAAHLRILCYSNSRNLDTERHRAEAVTALRAKLSERDRALLSLCGVLNQWGTNAPADEVASALAKSRGAIEAFPNDAEIVLYAASNLDNLGAHEEAKRQVARAKALDPKFILADAWGASIVAFSEADVDGFVTELEACVVASPGATDCLRSLLWADAVLGRCDGYDAIARKLQAVAPDASWFYNARALATRGAPIAAVRDALVRAIEFDPNRGTRHYVDASVALLAGDLAAAETALEAAALRDYASTTDERAAEWTRDLLETALEAGDTARAIAVAKRYLDGSSVRTDNASSLARPLALQILRRAGALSDEKLRVMRADIVEKGRMYWPQFGRNQLFYDVYAATAYTPEEARDAIAALPRFSPLPKTPFYTPYPSGRHDGYVGRVMGIMYSLAGRFDDAIPYLRKGVAACDLLGATLAQVRAHVALGGALEAKGDKPGACAEYRWVLGRWPAPKPRSVSVDTARARVAALGCAKGT